MRVLLLLLALTGCGAPQQLLTRVDSVPAIKIPILEKCPRVEDIPVRPSALMPKFDSEDAVLGREKETVALLGADVAALDAYAVRADALLQGCAR